MRATTLTLRSRLLLACVAATLIAVFTVRAFATDQAKTIRTFIGDSDTQISGPVDKPFSLYIGDNLSGVTDPIKSAYVAASGIYTGGGTLEFRMNGSAPSSRVFTLPNVSAPTPFEILYKDPASTVNPATAGTYSYTLNVIPSGITVSAFGAEVRVTYRYVPDSCPDGQSTNEKAKTIRTFIGDSDTQISGPVDKPFSLYIGDNLSGVTDPIKSAYVAASGIYTGGGTLEFRMNGSAPSSRVFTLPNVSAPTPFEILYKDPASTVNPATAGTYSYTLNVIPSGITVSAFGAEVRVTYRYKPACVGGYPATGAVTSVVFDTGVAEGAAYNSILWKGTLGGPGQDTGRVRFQFATSNATSTSDPSWVFYGASGGSCTTNTWFDASVSDTPVELLCPGVSFSNKRYFRYRVQICSANNCTDPGAATPVVTSVVVSWSP